MNQRAAKGFRRDIRRAVGLEALRVIEAHGTALDRTIPTVNSLDARTTDLHERMGELKARVDKLDARMNALSDGIVSRSEALSTCFRRLRWLFTGRL